MSLSISNFDALPEGLQQSWWLLCEFAFQAMEKDKIVFSKEELVDFFPQSLVLDDKIHCFGLLQSSESILDVGCGVSFHFLHLTFQEYLAALHLTKQPPDKQLKVFQPYNNSKVNPDYDSLSNYRIRFTMVCTFFFGIYFHKFNMETQKFDVKEAIKCVMGRDIFSWDNLSGCHCAFESKNDLINDEVIQLLSQSKINFGYPRTAHDCAAVLHVISNMQECSGMKINFDNSGVRENQIRTLADVLASKQGKLQVKSLHLSGNKLTDETLGDLFHRASAAFRSLNSLNLSGNRIGAESINFITTVLAESPSSRSSWLEFSKLTSGLPQLLRDGTPNVSTGLRHVKLNLNETNVGDKGLSVLIESLEGPCYLRNLELMDSDIHATGVSCLSDSICSGKIVMGGDWSKLHLDDNPLGLEGTVAIGRMLSSSHCQLRSVTLSMCQLTKAGGGLPNTDCDNNEVVREVGQQLCQMPQNNTITWLILDGNSFTGEGIHVLAGFMHLCPCLRFLSSSHSRITSDDLRQILDRFTQIKVSVCNKLENWNLRSNTIDDSGVSALMDHLPSLFPRCGAGGGIYLRDNPVSSEMMRRLKEEMARCRKVRCYVSDLLYYYTLCGYVGSQGDNIII